MGFIPVMSQAVFFRTTLNPSLCFWCFRIAKFMLSKFKMSTVIFQRVFLDFLFRFLTSGVALSWVIFSLKHQQSTVPGVLRLSYLLIQIQSSSAYISLSQIASKFVLNQNPQDFTVFQTNSSFKVLFTCKGQAVLSISWNVSTAHLCTQSFGT